MNSIIVAAPPIFGETAPLLQLAEELVQRGHSVTALLGRRFAPHAERIGARFIPLTGRADFDVQQLIADHPERLTLPPGPEQLNWDHTEAFVKALTAQHEALQRLLDEDPEASLLCNSLFFGAFPVALGAPGRRPRRWVAVVANPVVAADDATTAFGPIPDVTGDAAVEAHRAACAQFSGMFDPARQVAQELLNALGTTRPMPSYITAVYELPDAVAALTVPEFDFPRSTPPASLAYAGILPPQPAPDAAKPEWWDELDGSRPVVVVTQGTLANGDLSQLVEPTLEALADKDLLVIAALGRDPADLGVDPPANARIVEYVPFDELLPRADVLVTNGGFGGTQHAIAAGVPVVMCGTTEDKPMTAARVTFHHVGLDLATADPAPAQVAEAVDTLLGDPSYREAAARLGPAYAGREPVHTVEALLR